MLKLRRGVGWLLALLLFGVGIYLGARLTPLLGSHAPTREFNTPALLLRVQALSQLVTVKYVIEKVEPWDDPPGPILSLFGAGDNRILLLAHGIVKAGVDLNKFTRRDLHVQGNTVTVRLPDAHITDAYLDDSQTKVIQRSTGFLRSFNKDLEQDIRRRAVEDIRNAALRGGILRDAEQRAQTELGQLFLELGFKKVQFQPSLGPGPTVPDLAPDETDAGTNR